MDLTSAKALSRFRGAIEQAPSNKKEFERNPNQWKMSQLGARMFSITKLLPKGNHNYRKFTHTFTAEDSSTLKLEMTLAYKTSNNEVDIDGAYYIVALWSSGGQELMIERMDEAFISDHSPDEVTNMFNRLEETVTVAEEAYATAVAPTN